MGLDPVVFDIAHQHRLDVGIGVFDGVRIPVEPQTDIVPELAEEDALGGVRCQGVGDLPP